MTAAERADLLARGALVAGLCGLLATVPISSAVQGVLLLVFLLGGVGSAVMCWIELPTAATVAAVVGLSVASVLATSALMAWVPFWGPVACCVVLSVAVMASGLLRLRALRKPTVSETPW